jgi:hypothetical protein
MDNLTESIPKASKKRGNPLWRAGNSGNPQGRQRQSEKSKDVLIKAATARWLKGKMTVMNLNRLYDDVDSRMKVQLILAIYQSSIPRAQPTPSAIERLTPEELNKLHDDLMAANRENQLKFLDKYTVNEETFKDDDDEGQGVTTGSNAPR